MIKLKLSVYESPLTMRNLLQNMPNLRYLTVETDDINVNGHQWKQIIIEYLPKLTVAPYHGDNDLDSQSQLQALLDRAPCLYSLRFASWPSSSTQMPPFEYSNKSVRRLHLQDVDRCYDSQQCAKLSRSPLGIQCEVLSITVDNRKNVIDLINTMTNLRALNVVCRDDTWKEDDNNQSSSTEDELIEWLQHCLPSTCTITRNDDNIYNSRFIRSRSVRLWIR
ncbi:unnamed protein product [Didymodactylos carnosus]|uniref:Uncharacterized protein n=1 Tax=Didymodactylos carnosus TaxID=1234261 RepID=A0A8S2SJS8_9BILA|nr:unnamed protein product [Didymodactylos carnosus]